MPQGHSVADIIDEAPVGWLQIRTFIFCILVSLLDGFDTQSIAFVAPSISTEWGLSKLSFGFVFSATLLGTVIGAAVFGVLADRVGRKRLVLLNTVIFGLFTGACAFARNVEMLLLFRLLGGIGMGGVIPNMMALASEYAPRRKRATIVTFTLWGFPAGAALGGLAATPLIARFGWESVFVAGAIAPLVLAAFLLPYLPESLRFLEQRATNRPMIVQLLRRIDPVRASGAVLVPASAEEARQAGVGILFTKGLALPTAVISAAMFLSLFLTYLLLNWIPLLLEAAGMSLAQAILGTVAVNLGGIAGSYLLARVIDNVAQPLWYLIVGYLAAGCVIALTGRMVGSPALVLMTLAGCGVFLIGTQMSLSAYAATRFPPAVRGRAVGFIQAVGRTGSLIGPVVGGALLGFGVSPKGLFALGFLPAALAALLLVILAGSVRRHLMFGQGRPHVAYP